MPGNRKDILTRAPRPDLNDALRDSEVEVRVYVLRAHRLQPAEGGENLNAFLYFELGGDTVYCKDDIKWGTLDPDFFKCHIVKTVLPGISLLKVGVRNQLLLDSEIVGATTIDLEDRWFCDEWRKVGSHAKPIELRELYKDAFQPQASSPSCAIQRRTRWIDDDGGAGQDGGGRDTARHSTAGGGESLFFCCRGLLKCGLISWIRTT